MHSRDVIQSHTFSDVAKRQLGQPGRAPMDWQTHWWPSVVIHNSSAYAGSTCKPLHDFWTTLEDSSKACSISCSVAVKSCKRNCKRSKAGVRCIDLCKCEGGCVINEKNWFIYWFIDWLAMVIIVLIFCCFSVMNMLSKGTLVHTISVIFFTNVHVYL